MASKQRTSNGRIKEVGDWSEQTSSTGKRYYYNEKTQVSQWKKPTEWLEYERKLAKKREERKSLSRQNDYKDHSTTPIAVSKRTSPSSTTQGTNGDVDDRRKIISKPSTSNNTISMSNKTVDSLKLVNRHHTHSPSSYIHNSSSNKKESTPQLLANNGVGVYSPHLNNRVSSSVLDASHDAVSSNATPNTGSRGTPHYDNIRRPKRERNGDDMSKPDEGPSAPKQQELDFHHSVFTNLQPPPMAPDLVMEEPVDMEVADSPPPSVYTRPFNTFVPPKMPIIMPFDESSYTNNRFYNPKLCAYRKQISYDSAMNDIKHGVQKHSKAQKDLLELETSIISVQSLVLTAHCNSELKRIQSLQNGDMKRHI